MSRGLRIALWMLSSLAVLWTIIAIVGLFTMGGMMRGTRDTAMGGGMQGMMDGMMGGGWMMGGMMLQMGLTWLVMLGLDALFIYLLVTARQGLRSSAG